MSSPEIESQYEAPYSRACSQAHKLRKRLGYEGSLDDPFPPKPKRMHWTTYRQLEIRDEQLQNQWAAGAMRWMETAKQSGSQIFWPIRG